MMNRTHFRAVRVNLLWQIALAVVYITMVLFCASFIAQSVAVWAVVVGSLSSSACSVFAIPSSVAANPRKIIGGYVIGLSVGLLVHFMIAMLSIHMDKLSVHPHFFWIFASIGVGLTMTIMALTGLEHPPAVGAAIVLVLNVEGDHVFWMILLFALALAGIRKVLGNKLKDLVDNS